MEEFHAVIFNSDGVLGELRYNPCRRPTRVAGGNWSQIRSRSIRTRFVGLSMPDYYASLADDH